MTDDEKLLIGSALTFMTTVALFLTFGPSIWRRRP